MPRLMNSGKPAECGVVKPQCFTHCQPVRRFRPSRICHCELPSTAEEIGSHFGRYPTGTIAGLVLADRWESRDPAA